MKPLSDHELQQLVDAVHPRAQMLMARLLEELRERRDQDSNREFFAEQEQTW